MLASSPASRVNQISTRVGKRKSDSAQTNPALDAAWDAGSKVIEQTTPSPAAPALE